MSDLSQKERYEVFKAFVQKEGRLPVPSEYENLGLADLGSGQCSCRSMGECAIPFHELSENRNCYADQLADTMRYCAETGK
jgi:hypothetical protein